MSIVIIKYNAGNVRSVNVALQRLGVEAVITDDPNEISNADKIIFPGVGAAAPAMQYLQQKKLDVLIQQCEKPFLGICLGMQLLCDHSEEGNTRCLGVFSQAVKKFLTNEKVPQIGWNNIYDLKSSLFNGVSENGFMYFVHSYYAECGPNTIAKTNYGVEYSSGIQKDNFYAVQFHPEKSGDAGELILKNFLAL
ncbi:MAG TPA: imidazole glycerol phosphate synthase subunit HisH [Parafilimonas sp.]|nr:imidazole glycerol phosphate synthase subunit HisH [Parafilimonas sp.]